MRLDHLNYLESINNSLIGLGTTTSNNYNLQKIGLFRSSSTLIGLNTNITTDVNTFCNISNSDQDVYSFDYSLNNLKLSITSSSNSDKLGSSGENTLIIGRVDSNYDITSEVIGLNGTSQVLSVGNFQMINTCSILSVGSGKKAVGNIYIGTQNNGGMINAGKSGVFNGRCTVPRGYTGFLDSLTASNSQKITGNWVNFLLVNHFQFNKKEL